MSDKATLILMGIALAIVSIFCTLYSVSDLRDTSVKRHNFFKAVRLFFFIFLVPVFVAIITINVVGLHRIKFVTLPTSMPFVVVIAAACINLLVSIFFIYKPTISGLKLFRRNNKDNMKYNRAILKTRNGMLIILVVLLVALLINLL